MFNFKKIVGVLALTVALSQVMTAVPVYADETEVNQESEVGETPGIPCKHKGCDKMAESENAPCETCKNSFFDEEDYESINDEVHGFSITCVCGDIFEAQEPHWKDYKDGACICGYKPASTEGITCKHEGCENPAESDKAPCDECKSAFFDEEDYESVNDEVHGFSIKCVCGDEFVGQEPHWENYNNGVCICGYELKVSDDNATSEPTDVIEKEPTYESTAEEIHEAIAQAAEEKAKEEEELPVTAFVAAEEVHELPAEVQGETDTDTVFNVSQITTTRGFVAAVDKIAKANTEEKNMTFYSSNPFAFNVDSLAALFNANKEFVYMFSHNGHLYKITIPAGTKIDLEGEIFAGPLYIGAKLGTAMLVK